MTIILDQFVSKVMVSCAYFNEQGDCRHGNDIGTDLIYLGYIVLFEYKGTYNRTYEDDNNEREEYFCNFQCVNHFDFP